MTEVIGLPWYAEGQFVIRADGRSVCKVNGMSSDAILIAKAINTLMSNDPCVICGKEQHEFESWSGQDPHTYSPY